MARLESVVIEKWLQEQVEPIDPGIAFTGGVVLDMPDRMITVVKGSGSSRLTLDGLFEEMPYTVICRGGQNNKRDAEDMSQMVDRIIMTKLANLTYEDCYILSARWGGNGPQQEPITDRQSRFVFSCSYAVESSVE